MNFSFHPEAEKELNEAINYYEDVEPGLGYDFALEVQFNHQSLSRFPKGMGHFGRRCQEIFGKTFSIWYSVLRRERRNIHCGSNASSPKTRILETQNLKKPNDCVNSDWQTHRSLWVCQLVMRSIIDCF